MRETFYFGKLGETITDERKKQWLDSKGKILKTKGKSYLIEKIKKSLLIGGENMKFYLYD